MTTSNKPTWLRAAFGGIGLALLVSSVGCQVSTGGQTLPSAYYMSDDVQYFAPGTEFKLSNEAAAMNAFKAEQNLQQP